MKTLNKATLIILGIAVLFIIYLLECKRDAGLVLGDDEMIISKSVWSEVTALANKPPEIKIDTFWKKGKTVYVDRPVPIPVPDPADTTILVYSDTLSNDSINAWVDFKLRGELLSLKWGYTPLITEIMQETTIYVPQIVDNETVIYQREIYLSIVVGGNATSFGFGPDLDYINKKRNIYGFQFRRVGGENFYYFKLGTKILPR